MIAKIVREKEENQDFQSLDTLVVDLLDRVQEMADIPMDVTDMPTGFFALDQMTGGLQAGDLVVVAGRPSMGKTSLAVNIAEHVALHEQLPVAIFSMEIGEAQLTMRIVSSIGRIKQDNLRTGKLTDDEWPRLAEVIESMRHVSLHIDETPGLTVLELKNKAYRLEQGCGKLGLIVVDCFQLISVDSKESSRAAQLDEIARELKKLAKELQCPVVLTAQINRIVESRIDKRPKLGDIRDSGAIEDYADTVLFIYRDDYYSNHSEEPNVAEVIVAKQRNGPIGMVKLYFQKNQTRFENFTSDFL